MASMWGRTQAIKAAFVVGFLLLLLNLLGPRWDTKFEKPLQAFNARLSNTVHWPKRIHPHIDMAIQSNISSTVVVDVKSSNVSQDTNLNKSRNSSDEKKPDVSFIQDINSNNNTSNEINISSSNKTNGNKLYANSTIIVLTNNNNINNNHDSIDYHKDSLSSVTSTVAPTNKNARTPSTPTKPKSRKEFIAALMQQLGINPCPVVPDDLGE